MKITTILNNLLMGEKLLATEEIANSLQTHFEVLNLGTITTAPSTDEGIVVITYKPSDIELGVLPSHLDFEDDFNVALLSARRNDDRTVNNGN